LVFGFMAVLGEEKRRYKQFDPPTKAADGSSAFQEAVSPNRITDYRLVTFIWP